MLGKIFKIIFSVIFSTLTIGLVVYAFTGPSNNPPTGNGGLYGDEAGRIGIGTSTLIAKLEVATSSDYVLRLSHIGATSTIFKIGADGAMVINNNGSDTMIFKNGQVGINTLNPGSGYALDVNGTLRATSIEGSYSGTVSAANVSSGQFGANTGGGNYSFPNSLAIGTSTVSYVLQAYKNTASAVNIIVENNEGVSGIGADGGNLIFYANNTQTLIQRWRIERAGSILVGGNGQAKGAYIRGEAGSKAMPNYSFNEDTDTGMFSPATGNIAFSINNSEKIRIDSSGNLGVGTTTPSAKLEVIGLIKSSGGISLTTSTANIALSGGDISGVDKLTATTIDPVYEINGQKYATYVSDYAGGVRTETSGVLSITQKENNFYKKEIDFNNLEEGGNLWLFWQTSNKNLAEVSIILTPSFNGDTWYKKQDKKIIIFSQKPGEVSFRLTAPRKDSSLWPNKIK